MVLEGSQALYPAAGTVRVAPDPSALRQPVPGRPDLNRFDDPDGRVAVRYTATRLVGALSETMARFRPSSATEETLAAVRGTDLSDLDWPPEDTSGVEDWLDRQRVGTVRITTTGRLLDLEDTGSLLVLDKHPRVRSALQAIDSAAHLDVALARLGGRIGRPLSRAVGAAVRDIYPDVLGIGYRSRLLTDEPCWALWGWAGVDVTSARLDPGDPQHREAVRTVAGAFGVRLPVTWL